MKRARSYLNSLVFLGLGLISSGPPQAEVSAPESSLPRAHIEAVSYKVRLPDGNVTYPNLTRCLPQQNFSGVGALALNDLGVAVLAAGIEQLYGPELAAHTRQQWLQQRGTDGLLPGLLVLQTTHTEAHTYACDIPGLLSTPAALNSDTRPKVTNMTYQLRLPDDSLIFPTMDFCLKGSSAEGLGLLAFSDEAIAITQAGLEQLYGTESAALAFQKWQHKMEPSNTRLPSMVTLRTPITKNDDDMSWLRKDGLTFAATPPEVASRCGNSSGGGHDPKN